VIVVGANSLSRDYSLTAVLDRFDQVNTWTVDTATLSLEPTQISAAASYGSPVSHTLKLKIPFANTTGAISNNINFVAMAN